MSQNIPFGGISVIFCDDIWQLHSVKDRFMWAESNKTKNSNHCKLLLKYFQMLLSYKKNHRISSDNESQVRFL